MLKKNLIEHSFFCINCGKKNLPIFRNKGHQHSKFHRKRMYCPYCKNDYNMVECKNYDEVNEFHDKFEKGEFKNEAEESLDFVRRSGQW